MTTLARLLVLRNSATLLESHSCTKTTNNSNEIILFHKKRGWGVPLKLYLNSRVPGGRREYQHGLLARRNDVLSNAGSDFGNPCLVGPGRRG